MARAAGWSWLPCDLLNQVADNLLATGDVDCYLNLRAVCHNWRDAIAAPCGHDDPRFLPRGWVMLDSDARNARGLFLNVDTGRLLLKDLPSLRDCAFVATDDNGLLILHGPTPSKNFSALNPFTSASISFPRQYPAFALHDLVVAAGTSPKVMLHIFQDQERATLLDLNSEFTNQWSFPAGPALEFFDSVVSCQGCVYATDRNGTIAELDCHRGITTIVDGGWQEAWRWRPSFLVDNSGELLVVHVPRLRNTTMHVFSIDLENKVPRVKKTIGNRAIFLGNRSLSIHVGNLPTIEANCIYYIGAVFDAKKQRGVYMHCLDDGTEKLVEPFDTAPSLPLSLTRILMNYANYSGMTGLANNVGA
jgi:hypothetical protein